MAAADGSPDERRSHTLRTHKIAAIPGDGIGPEVIAAGLEVLEACAARDGGFELEVEHFDWGSDYYKRHGVMMPPGGHEQLRRFEDRQNDPLRRWKITDEDWRNRKKADQYAVAAEEMFERTDHHLAPWDLVSGEQKRHARVAVLETLIKRVEQGFERWSWDVPPQLDRPSPVRPAPGPGG